MRRALIVIAVALVGCHETPEVQAPSTPAQSRAAAEHAFAEYQQASGELFAGLMRLDRMTERLDHEGARVMWTKFLASLEVVDQDLAVVAADPTFAYELCLACIERDWNQSGEIDERDRKLLELEYDGHGGELPEGDPRRRPTFRFDVGDALWARAMIAFQRAFVEIVLAYRWNALDRFDLVADRAGAATIALTDADRVKRARTLVLAGLRYAEQCRAAYLAETDDDREWVPSPTQQSHPVPLVVDRALYDTWAGLLDDVRGLLESKQGIGLRSFAALFDDDLAAYVPDAYLDVGAMLRDPEDIVVDLRGTPERESQWTPEHVALVLRRLVGNGYRDHMSPSPLVGRLARVRDNLVRGDETVEHKLRYLFWLN